MFMIKGFRTLPHSKIQSKKGFWMWESGKKVPKHIQKSNKTVTSNGIERKAYAKSPFKSIKKVNIPDSDPGYRKGIRKEKRAKLAYKKYGITW